MDDHLSRAYDRFTGESSDDELDALNRVFHRGGEAAAEGKLNATAQEIAVAESFLTTLEVIENEHRNNDPGEH